jgi:hypothetical protein
VDVATTNMRESEMMSFPASLRYRLGLRHCTDEEAAVMPATLSHSEQSGQRLQDDESDERMRHHMAAVVDGSKGNAVPATFVDGETSQVRRGVLVEAEVVGKEDTTEAVSSPLFASVAIADMTIEGSTREE